jgi:hypothetical protein
MGSMAFTLLGSAGPAAAAVAAKLKHDAECIGMYGMQNYTASTELVCGNLNTG